jgi:hypothetical protein
MIELPSVVAPVQTGIDPAVPLPVTVCAELFPAKNAMMNKTALGRNFLFIS